MAARIALLTAAAMVFFAANSVLTRLALAGSEAGAGGFTLIRLVSGAVTLWLICKITSRPLAGSWAGATALLGYAGFFSFAYLALPAGLGALILFACVQVTMLGAGLAAGEKLSVIQWAGVVAALAGLVTMLSPSLEAPAPWAAALMAASGVCWGLYSLIGRGAGDPTAQTAGNFARAGAAAALLAAPILTLRPETPPNPGGVVLACASGALASGLGYAIWYTALKGLSATRAGVAQLTVPVIAALGGVLFIAEPITVRFTLAGALVLAGVAVATLSPRARQP
ncbi:MAG: DMT family transporter [Pseudomonadota bacterium]